MNAHKTSPSRIKRLLRHLCSTRAAAQRAFPSATLKSIQTSIGAGEKRHRAQVKLIVEAALPLDAVWRGESSRQRAHELFSRYRIWDTEENCGVLVYINLADRKVEIVTDRGVNRAVARRQWEEVCRTMTTGYAQGRHLDGTLKALDLLHGILVQVFPADGYEGGHNELSDKPLLL